MENTNGENKIRKVLQNEIAQIIGIVSIVYTFVAYVILPIKAVQQDIENIKSNHLHTIEQNMAELKVLQANETKENSEAHQRIAEELTKTATILDQHLKKE